MVNLVIIFLQIVGNLILVRVILLYDHSGNQNHGTIVGATWEEIEEETVLGCTDPLATNYDINANSDDGTCSYPDNGNFSLSFDGRNR